jgi:hypothetical protein
MNIGHSSKLMSDYGFIEEKNKESIMPGKYRLVTDQIYNKNGCLKLVGPLASRGISTSVGNVVAPKQRLTDVSSYLSNRHLKHTALKKGRVNLEGVSKYPVKNDVVCGNNTYTSNSRMTHPTCSYREMAINRFYNPLRDPQRNIDPPRSRNTSLEAKDNWVPKIPRSMKTLNSQTTIPIYPATEM